MTTETKFLIRYGLQNYVRHTRDGERHTFVIHGQADPKLVGHAQSLIAERYGSGAEILIS
ncbi:hypothetical protein V5T82_03515 [Magnetovibrio sp. PR-2]|uniref:hypothetical protein n=1 Tax=Magnetovibrio sp. PR-2 TaxID=3120356 RepID=UPI002FCE05D9